MAKPSETKAVVTDMKISLDDGSPVCKAIPPPVPRQGGHFPIITDEWTRIHKKIISGIISDANMQENEIYQRSKKITDNVENGKNGENIGEVDDAGQNSAKIANHVNHFEIECIDQPAPSYESHVSS